MSNPAGRSPLFAAQHALRYERQQIIRDYQQAHDCRLVIMSDVIFPRSIPLLEEVLFDASPEEDLLDDSPSHGAVISSKTAKSLNLPVDEADPSGSRWQAIWRLWAKYVALGAEYVYEGQTASHIRAP